MQSSPVFKSGSIKSTLPPSSAVDRLTSSNVNIFNNSFSPVNGMHDMRNKLNSQIVKSSYNYVTTNELKTLDNNKNNNNDDDDNNNISNTATSRAVSSITVSSTTSNKTARPGASAGAISHSSSACTEESDEGYISSPAPSSSQNSDNNSGNSSDTSNNNKGARIMLLLSSSAVRPTNKGSTGKRKRVDSSPPSPSSSSGDSSGNSGNNAHRDHHNHRKSHSTNQTINRENNKRDSSQPSSSGGGSLDKVSESSKDSDEKNSVEERDETAETGGVDDVLSAPAIATTESTNTKKPIVFAIRDKFGHLLPSPKENEYDRSHESVGTTVKITKGRYAQRGNYIEGIISGVGSRGWLEVKPTKVVEGSRELPLPNKYQGSTIVVPRHLLETQETEGVETKNDSAKIQYLEEHQYFSNSVPPSSAAPHAAPYLGYPQSQANMQEQFLQSQSNYQQYSRYPLHLHQEFLQSQYQRYQPWYPVPQMQNNDYNTPSSVLPKTYNDPNLTMDQFLRRQQEQLSIPSEELQLDQYSQRQQLYELRLQQENRNVQLQKQRQQSEFLQRQLHLQHVNQRHQMPPWIGGGGGVNPEHPGGGFESHGTGV